MTGKETLDLFPTLFFPPWVGGEVDEHPARLFERFQSVVSNSVNH